MIYEGSTTTGIQPVQKTMTRHVENWFPPPAGTYKINTDAAISVEGGCVGLGYVIRNHLGEVVDAILDMRLSLMSSPTTESYGIFGMAFTLVWILAPQGCYLSQTH